MLVDFFIIGAQKGGTTALDSLLRRHPSVEMARIKEIHYFDDEGIDWNNPDRSRLHDQFEGGKTQMVRGEATPIYLYWPNALERLKRYNENAKTIICLRHPSFRAFSHWRMEYKREFEALSFAEAISDAGRARIPDAPGGAHRVFSYIERGYYSEQIERLLSLFGRSQTLFLRTDELWANPVATLAGMHEFLGVSPRPQDGIADYVVSIDSRELGGLPDECRGHLAELFRHDIERTALLTGLVLDDWLDPGYAEPMGLDADPISG